MADVPSTLNSWSATASSNSPTDATTIGSGLADNLQALQAVVRGDLASVGANIASSANPDVGAVVGLYHTVTGNNTIAGLGSTATAGIWKILEFAGTPPLVHSTALQLLGNATIQAAAGDVGIFLCQATSQWKMISYFKDALSPGASASSDAAGVVELATDAETLAGSDTTRVVTPSALDSVLGIVKLATGTVSNAATADVTMTGYTSYANKMLLFRNFVPATDGAALQLRVSTDGGANYDSGASDYAYLMHGSGSATTVGDASAVGNVAGNTIPLTMGTADDLTASGGVSGCVKMFGTENAARSLFLFESISYSAAVDSLWDTRGSGARNATQNTDAVRMFFSSGNIGSGVWDLYGFN